MKARAHAVGAVVLLIGSGTLGVDTEALPVWNPGQVH